MQKKMPPTTHSIVTVVKLNEQSYRDDKQAISLARTFRNFRLLALKTAPSAFAASYHEESRRRLDQTIERLTNTRATQFVALSCSDSEEHASVGPAEATVEHLLSNDWHGTIVILGPQEASAQSVTATTDPFGAVTSLTTEEANVRPGKDSQLHYHLNGIFVVPQARGSGLGRRLIEAALGKARADADRLKQDCSCTIIVDEMNAAAKSLYERCGFAVVSKETYVQRPRGLVHGESQSEERIALRMEYRYRHVRA